jgi:predicted nucleic acid-binding protein
MKGVTYDAGALIAAERGSRSMWELHRRALDDGLRPTLSTAVLGQVWRGGPQPLLSRLVKGCRVVPVTESQARAAGTALARSGTDDLVDAVVAITALARGGVLVTSDPDDMRLIVDALDGQILLHVV